MKGKPPEYLLHQVLYFKIPEDQILFWRSNVNQWLDFCKGWGALSTDTVLANRYRWGHDGYFEMPENIWDVEKFKRKGLHPPMVPQVDNWNHPSRSRGHISVPQGMGNSLITAPLPGGMRVEDFELTPDPRRVIMPTKVAFQEPKSPGTEPKAPVTPNNRQQTPSNLWDRIEHKQEEKEFDPPSYWSQYNSKPTVSDTSVSETYVAPSSNNPAAQYLSVQALKGIELKALSAEAITKWWKQVEAYERSYGLWDRNQIDPEVRDRINSRWMDESIWRLCLPAEIQQAIDNGWRPKSFEWLSHEVISSSKLYTYLLNMAQASRGHAVGELKHEELIAWIQSQHLDFTKENFVESYEIFEVNFKRQRKNLLDTVELAVEHAKLVCKEIHAMCTRSLKRLKTSDQSIWRCIHISMTQDRKDDLDKTMSHLHAGYRSAVQQIITNPVFNDDLFKKSYSSDKKVEDRKVEDRKVEDEQFKSKHRRDKEKKGGEKSSSPRGDRSVPSSENPAEERANTKERTEMSRVWNLVIRKT